MIIVESSRDEENIIVSFGQELGIVLLKEARSREENFLKVDQGA
jgi:hypothetical protein